MADYVLARLKPHNPKVGNTLKTYTYKGTRFREEAGWYRIPAPLGEELKQLVVDEADPYNSPLAFDVLSEEEALKVEDREARRRERATVGRANRTDLRNTESRRLGEAAGVVTTRELRANQAPNDEIIPNGYPPPRVYPMPRETGTQTGSNFYDAPAFEEQADAETYQKAIDAGVDDKTVSVSGANIGRDMQGMAPRLVDGQDPDGGDDHPIDARGDTDFGRDPADGEMPENPDDPTSPPSARRRKNRG
jgi:hypothetical protein